MLCYERTVTANPLTALKLAVSCNFIPILQESEAHMKSQNSLANTTARLELLNAQLLQAQEESRKQLCDLQDQLQQEQDALAKEREAAAEAREALDVGKAINTELDAQVQAIMAELEQVRVEVSLRMRVRLLVVMECLQRAAALLIWWCTANNWTAVHGNIACVLFRSSYNGSMTSRG